MALEKVAATFPVHPDCAVFETLSKCQKMGAILKEERIYAFSDKVIPPSGYQTELIDLYHRITHQGVQKMYAMLQQTWFWPEMFNDASTRVS